MTIAPSEVGEKDALIGMAAGKVFSAVRPVLGEGGAVRMALNGRTVEQFMADALTEQSDKFGLSANEVKPALITYFKDHLENPVGVDEDYELEYTLLVEDLEESLKEATRE